MARKRAHVGFPHPGFNPWLDLSYFMVGSDTLKSGLFSSQAVNSALDDKSQRLALLTVRPPATHCIHPYSDGEFKGPQETNTQALP